MKPKKTGDMLGTAVIESAVAFAGPEKPATTARGRRHKPGTMNRLEASYASHLEELRAGGAIIWWQFEAVRLRLAQNTFYTPDFFIMVANGELEVREVKGFWEDDARVKIKVAADRYPFRFVAVTRKPKKDGGGWKHESIGL